MQSVLSKGRNVDEAINLGLKLMDIPKHKANIEIVKQGKERFITFFSEKAVVKLTKNKKSHHGKSIANIANELFDSDEKGMKTPTPLENRLPQESDSDEFQGKVWIEDGEIFCQTTADSFPTIDIPRQLTVLINGRAYKGKTLVLSEKETYELRPQVVEGEMKWDISMDSQKLKVLLHVEPSYRIEYVIMDAAPAKHIELIAVENKKVLNTLKFQDVIEKMGLMGIRNGFDLREIMKAAEATEPATFVIAEGKPPKEGENGWLELKVNTKVQVGLKEKDDGRVDFREIKSFPNVDKGKVIGIIHPPIPGEIGYTITKEPVLSKETFPLVVEAGKGVAVIGNEIVAKESGRPQIEQKGLYAKASIVQKLTHIGNVDLSSGNISFKGDVEVIGEVIEQMLVVATGDIAIHKTVNNAIVSSTGGVRLHSNSIGSTITAGNLDFQKSELLSQLKILVETVDELYNVLTTVTGSEHFKNSEYYKGSLQPLIRILIEKKFEELPPGIKKFNKLTAKSKTSLEDGTWREIGDSLSNLFLSLSNEIISRSRIQQLSITMKNLVERNLNQTNEEASITTLSATNSRLICSGEVYVTGNGCINTKIQAGGYVKINGILRGGEVYGGMGVTVGEAGSLSSSSTVIAVPNNKSIRIDKALEGVVLKVGHEVYKFTNTAFKVHARIDQNDKLSVDFE